MTGRYGGWSDEAERLVQVSVFMVKKGASRLEKWTGLDADGGTEKDDVGVTEGDGGGFGSI